MSLNRHGTQYVLSQQNKILQTLEFYWLCSKTSKFKVKWAGSHYIALP